ncbi:MAG: hypothetical protein M0T74_07905 [Desulfitobacterium hafniense]|nr:hypothetical protein [Desulfitobacterium hafniense]
MKKIFTKGFVIILTLSLALIMIGCSKDTSAPKEPAKSNQTEKAPADSQKADSQKAPVQDNMSKTSPDTTKQPTTDNKDTSKTATPASGTESKAPGTTTNKTPGKGPVVEEESCDC